MSKIAKAIIEVPANVKIDLQSDKIDVSGPKGKLEVKLNKFVNVNLDNNILSVKPIDDDKKTWAMAGTIRALINNLVVGVSNGFQKTLELVGVGYRAQLQGRSLSLSLGFSHPVAYPLPEGVEAEVPSNTTVVLKSANKQLLGQVAAEIRSFREPEPYKGKGIKYSDEMVVRKETKKK